MSDRQLPHVLQTLLAARKLIEREENWCNNGPGDGTKTRCALMAIGATTQGKVCSRGLAAAEALRQAMQEMGGGVRSISRFNDSHSHAEVLAAFDRAIVAQQAGVPHE